MRGLIVAAAFTAFCSPAAAQISDYVLDELEGYELIAKKKIAGYISERGNFEDSFEGCDFDRVIVFTDDTAVDCTQFKYTYAYRPDAYIFSDGGSLKMVVKDKVFRVRRHY